MPLREGSTKQDNDETNILQKIYFTRTKIQTYRAIILPYQKIIVHKQIHQTKCISTHNDGIIKKISQE